ncbi:MAG: AbrB/MazE/SpoVT family DNA-binding domain-containing protein [Bacillota bacterium]|nr:AbrB/MazE/SpoVT family DNA-binding domain-containing protein [Bacillota bacterium]
MDLITLSSKGQIVIPREILQKYNLKKGDRFLVTVENDRIILELKERHPILALRGAFSGKGSLTRALLQERKAESKLESGRNG